MYPTVLGSFRIYKINLISMGNQVAPKKQGLAIHVYSSRNHVEWHSLTSMFMTISGYTNEIALQTICIIVNVIAACNSNNNPSDHTRSYSTHNHLMHLKSGSVVQNT